MSVIVVKDAAYWLKLYGRDPEALLKEGVKVPEVVYVDSVLERLKLKREAFTRFEGSNGCVAWAWSPKGPPVMTRIDELGQPQVRVDEGTVIVSWNPTIRSWKGRFYDFLAYEAEALHHSPAAMSRNP